MKNLKIISLICLLGIVAPATAQESTWLGRMRIYMTGSTPFSFWQKAKVFASLGLSSMSNPVQTEQDERTERKNRKQRLKDQLAHMHGPKILADIRDCWRPFGNVAYRQVHQLELLVNNPAEMAAGITDTRYTACKTLAVKLAAQKKDYEKAQQDLMALAIATSA